MDLNILNDSLKIELFLGFSGLYLKLLCFGAVHKGCLSRGGGGGSDHVARRSL
jgi:hypothetical protein